MRLSTLAKPQARQWSSPRPECLSFAAWEKVPKLPDDKWRHAKGASLCRPRQSSGLANGCGVVAGLLSLMTYQVSRKGNYWLVICARLGRPAETARPIPASVSARAYSALQLYQGISPRRLHTLRLRHKCIKVATLSKLTRNASRQQELTIYWYLQHRRYGFQRFESRSQVAKYFVTELASLTRCVTYSVSKFFVSVTLKNECVSLKLYSKLEHLFDIGVGNIAGADAI